MTEQQQDTQSAADGQSGSTDGLGGWQPIDTVPTDEDLEFLGCDGDLIDKTWKGWDDDGKIVYVRADWIPWEPTLWMPLPPLPNVEVSGGRSA